METVPWVFLHDSLKKSQKFILKFLSTSIFFKKKSFSKKRAKKNWKFLRYFDSLKKIAKVDGTDEWCLLFQKKNKWNEKLSSSRDHRKYYFCHKRENLLRNWFLFFWRQFSFFGENSPKKALTLTVGAVYLLCGI